jgi:hypothetical protein
MISPAVTSSLMPPHPPCTEGASAGASAGPATGTQAKTNYRNGTAVFVHTKGGLMYEAAIGGQKFSFKAK